MFATLLKQRRARRAAEYTVVGSGFREDRTPPAGEFGWANEPLATIEKIVRRSIGDDDADWLVSDADPRLPSGASRLIIRDRQYTGDLVIWVRSVRHELQVVTFHPDVIVAKQLISDPEADEAIIAATRDGSEWDVPAIGDVVGWTRSSCVTPYHGLGTTRIDDATLTADGLTFPLRLTAELVADPVIRARLNTRRAPARV